VLRNGDGPNLREYLIETAARLIDQRGTAGLAVRDIAKAAQVSDGALYNYFADKEDLLVHALLAHVGNVMHSQPPMPEPGTGTVLDNLRMFIDNGLATLARVTPAFAGLLSQPNVLARFHAMVGGDEAFGVAIADDPPGHGGAPGPDDSGSGSGGSGSDDSGSEDSGSGGSSPRGLPDMLSSYLRAEQRLGRIAADADVGATATLVVGAIHGQILPQVLLSLPGTPVTSPPGLSARLAAAVLHGIAPR
jgi:AcrR family transcriptional regulator